MEKFPFVFQLIFLAVFTVLPVVQTLSVPILILYGIVQIAAATTLINAKEPSNQVDKKSLQLKLPLLAPNKDSFSMKM